MAIEDDAWGKFGDFNPGTDDLCEGCPALKDGVCLRWGQGTMRFTPSCVS